MSATSPTAMQDEFSAFDGPTMIARGNLAAVVRAAHGRTGRSLLVFADETGRQVEPDLRGSLQEALARLPPPSLQPAPTRGRPKLGVTAREVTLLPRHWEWLATQPGGASAALRRLVEAARRESALGEADRQARDAAYGVMNVLAGDLPGYEEATRAFFASDFQRLDTLIEPWPADVRDYVRRLLNRINVQP